MKESADDKNKDKEQLKQVKELKKNLEEYSILIDKFITQLQKK